MARTVNKEEYAARRNEILAAAQRLIYTQGYERMTIQALAKELGMSNGAFYHYFASKPAVLEALIEWGQPKADDLLVPIVHDPRLGALEKLGRFFAALDVARTEQRALLADLLRIWFADENAIVREKSDAVIVAHRAPMLNAIVRQGLQEGVFTTPYPDQAGLIILAITRGTNNALLQLMIAVEPQRAEQTVREIIALVAASAEAIERVLGAAAPCIHRPDAAAVKGWLAGGQARETEQGVVYAS